MNILEAREKLPDSDKVTVNLGLVDLAQMDLLVREAFYTNRTDFVRTAIRNQLLRHADAIRDAAQRKHFVMGLQRYSRADLEHAVAAGTRLEIHVLGLAALDDDVSPELARAAISSLHVLGAFVAAPAVKQALNDRLHT
ncbi:CopG family transcriptional regulator [Massilia sp. TS11]|uniref:CopG family transcriptional regulator n=1 Tax=Massilia sp. TS11 TaxID=2908003 RepID=UPI001EDA8640|nr:CopG family transcriptional regulator [Massilia sp. TS11]MCG2586110.1 CopG family transcriptional regulator [Massilia sp. TS11]